MKTAEIIEKCCKGDQAAFGLLYENFSDRIFSTAFRILNNEDDAGDIVQETFISVWKNLHRYDPAKDFGAWISRIAINNCYDMLRKAKNNGNIVRDESQLALLLSKEKEPGENLSNKDYAGLIKALTEKLSPKQKIVFVLIEFEEYTHDEVEDITGMSKTTIKSNLNHARRTIGEQVRKYDRL